jgi:hypothetical protein
MSAVGNQTAYALPVEGGPTTMNCFDREIVVTEVEWRAYIFEGEAFRIITALADDSDNRSWNLKFDAVPDWVPRPPAAWFVLADEITAQAVTR